MIQKSWAIQPLIIPHLINHTYTLEIYIHILQIYNPLKKNLTMTKQTTISKSVSLSGVGIHTGKKVKIT